MSQGLGGRRPLGEAAEGTAREAGQRWPELPWDRRKGHELGESQPAADSAHLLCLGQDRSFGFFGVTGRTCASLQTGYVSRKQRL